MQSTVDISVVVTTYNQDERALTLTLNSILQQNCTSFEIIVADDCSRVDPSPFIQRFFGEKGFENYTIARASENIGTVANVAQGISAAKGRIVKPLSPGDALFGPSTLSDIVQCCDEQNVQLGFGGIISYLPDGSFSPYNAPRALDLYTSPRQDSGDVLRSHILKTDWIPGCSLFYERDLMLPYLHELTDRAHVRYCEDLACPLCAADGVRIGYLGEPVIWYEMGTGISTSGSSASVRRMYTDHHNFYQYIQNRIKDNALARRALTAFKVREFIALQTPFYRLAQRQKQSEYSNSSLFNGDEHASEIDFFASIKTYDSHLKQLNKN